MSVFLYAGTEEFVETAIPSVTRVAHAGSGRGELVAPAHELPVDLTRGQDRALHVLPHLLVLERSLEIGPHVVGAVERPVLKLGHQ